MLRCELTGQRLTDIRLPALEALDQVDGGGVGVRADALRLDAGRGDGQGNEGSLGNHLGYVCLGEERFCLFMLRLGT